MADKKMRSQGIKREQYCIMADYLEGNPILIHGKTSPSDIKNVENLWSELAQKLNICVGPKKTMEQWKKAIVEWKCKVKAKAREVKMELKRTGGGDRTVKQLTDVELRLMGIIGWVNIDGNNHLMEFGLPLTSTQGININNVVLNPQLQDTSRQGVELEAMDMLSTSSQLQQANETEDQTPTNERGGVELEAFDNPSTSSQLQQSNETEDQIPTNERKRRRVQQKFKSNTATKQNSLMESAKLYEQSTVLLCNAMKTISNTISEVAQSIHELAASQHDLAESNRRRAEVDLEIANLKNNNLL